MAGWILNSLDSTPLSPGRSALFLLGAAIAATGLWIMRSVDLLALRLPGIPEIMYRYVHTPREVVVGGAVVLTGVLIAAFAVMGSIPDRLGGTSLAGVRVWSLRRSGPPLIAGAFCYAIVLGMVFRENGSPWVFLLFLAAIAFFGFAAHRADVDSPGARTGFRRGDVVIVAVLVALIVSVNLVDLTHWRFSFIGDEGAFFALARDIADGTEVNLFDLSGVYKTHPILDSVYLACFLKVFGADIIGWRLAEIFALAASAVLIYTIVLILFGRLPAVVAAVIVGCNHCLMAFARIGYNNLHGVFWLLLVVLFLILAWRSEQALFTFLTGTAMGLCIYTFPAAMLIWPVVAFLIGVKILRRPTLREVAAIGLMLVGFFLVVTPGLMTTPPDHLTDLVADHGHREMAAQDPVRVAHFSLVRSVLVFWVNPQWYHHFVGGPLLDPISCVLFSIGVALSLLLIGRGAPRVGLVWFGMGLFLIGVTNYVSYPLYTRLLVLIPACAILAAIGVLGLEKSLRGLRLPAWAVTGVVLASAAAIPIINLQQLLVESPMVTEFNHRTITVKALQENPGRVIIEVGEERDPTLDRTVRRYPWFRDFYEFSALDDLVLPPTAMGPESSLPIYLVRDAFSARMLGTKLPPNYVISTDVGLNGYPQIWLLMPSR